MRRLMQKQVKKTFNVDWDSESDGTWYETAPEVVVVLCGALENDVIIDSDL